MEDEKLTEISMKGAPPCGRCHIARRAVCASGGRHHRHVSPRCLRGLVLRALRPPASLLPGINGDRHRYQVREAKAA